MTDKYYTFSTIAQLINNFRVVPRLLMGSYVLIFYQTSTWFMGLPDPSAPQAAFISTIVGAGAAWFGMYVNSGNSQ